MEKDCRVGVHSAVLVRFRKHRNDVFYIIRKSAVPIQFLEVDIHDENIETIIFT